MTKATKTYKLYINELFKIVVPGMFGKSKSRKASSRIYA